MGTVSAVAAKLKRYKRWRKWRWVLSLVSAAFIALTGWLRLSGALRNFNYLREIRLFPGPTYIAISGGVRAFLFTAAFVLLFLRARSALFFTRSIAAAYLLWMWVDRIFLGTREAFRFYLASTLLISAFMLFFAFALLQPRDYP